MIGYLKGKLLSAQPPSLLLDVNGVGYEVEAPMSIFYNLPGLGQEVVLHTHLVVREDAQLLFGFSDLGQRQLFRDLLKVNGVGPRVALTILSTLEVKELIRCIENGDVSVLTRVPGVGKKTAERMMIDLRDRLTIHKDGDESIADGVTVHNAIDDAIGALMALGYKQNDANQAINAVKSESMQREDLIRNALQWLSRK